MASPITLVTTVLSVLFTVLWRTHGSSCLLQLLLAPSVAQREAIASGSFAHWFTLTPLPPLSSTGLFLRSLVSNIIRAPLVAAVLAPPFGHVGLGLLQSVWMGWTWHGAGAELERRWGSSRFLALYITSAWVGAVYALLAVQVGGSPSPASSGGGGTAQQLFRAISGGAGGTEAVSVAARLLPLPLLRVLSGLGARVVLAAVMTRWHLMEQDTVFPSSSSSSAPPPLAWRIRSLVGRWLPLLYSTFVPSEMTLVEGSYQHRPIRLEDGLRLRYRLGALFVGVLLGALAAPVMDYSGLSRVSSRRERKRTPASTAAAATGSGGAGGATDDDEGEANRAAPPPKPMVYRSPVYCWIVTFAAYVCEPLCTALEPLWRALHLLPPPVVVRHHVPRKQQQQQQQAAAEADGALGGFDPETAAQLVAMGVLPPQPAAPRAILENGRIAVDNLGGGAIRRRRPPPPPAGAERLTAAQRQQVEALQRHLDDLGVLPAGSTAVPSHEELLAILRSCNGNMEQAVDAVLSQIM